MSDFSKMNRLSFVPTIFPLFVFCGPFDSYFIFYFRLVDFLVLAECIDSIKMAV
jgi:hypothetical protein